MRIAVAAQVHQVEAFRRGLRGSILPNRQSGPGQPTAFQRRSQRERPQPLAIRRIEENQIESGSLPPAEFRRIATEQLGAVVRPAAPYVLPRKRERLRAIFDEGNLRSASRKRLEAERPRPGERSRTRAPVTGSSNLPPINTSKMLPRTLSEVGRRRAAEAPAPSGASVNPRQSPETTRTR